MSTFTCPLVRVGPVEKHANADSLGITMVGEYPVIVRLDGLREGDLAVYVPVDALCPPTGATAFLVFVPVIYAGPYSREAVVGLERGKTVIGNGAHIREGVVIRAAKERDFAPRACLKLVSEDYLLRKGGTEFH